MAKPIRESIKWTKNFKIDGVEGDPNELHDELYRMERLIIEQLPFTDGKIAATYGQKLASLRKNKLDLRRVGIEIEKIDINKVKSKANLAGKISDLMERVEEQDDYYLDQDLVDEVDELHEEAMRLIEEKGDNEIENISATYEEKFEYLQGVLEQKEEFESDFEAIRKRLNDLLYEREALEKKISALQNDVRVMQENSFKATELEVEKNYKTIFRMKGKKTIEADHAASEVVKKDDKDKKFSENLVFADVTFIVKKDGKKSEVSIPVKIPNEGVVNLSRFKPAEYMSLGLGAKYDSSNDYTTGRIRDRYVRGLKILGTKIDANSNEIKLSFYRSDNFSHSEQTLFSALLDTPEARNNIAAKLHVRLGQNASEYKIIGMLLDIHTSRYMCDCCSTSALGFQDNSNDKLSFKQLMLSSVTREIEGIEVAATCQVHLRASASIDFQTAQKTEEDHNKKTVISSSAISEKDLRIDGRRAGAHYSSNDKSLLAALNNHTLFTSGDAENQRFKSAYGRAIRPLLEESAVKIQRGFMAYRAEKLSTQTQGLTLGSGK